MRKQNAANVSRAKTEFVLGWQKSMERFTIHVHNQGRVKGERALGTNASGFHWSMLLILIVLQPTAAAILRFVSASF